MARLDEQDAQLAEARKLLDAMADQPDPRVAAYRGVALNKTTAAPAGLLNSPAQRPAGAQDAAYKAMYDQWRNSPDPELRENALGFLMERAGLDSERTRMTPHNGVTHRKETGNGRPPRRHPP